MGTKLLIVLFLLSITGNIVLFFLWRQNRTAVPMEVALQKQYPLLSLQSIDPVYNTDLIENFLPLHQQIKNAINPFNDTFALYFEYLPTGTSVGVNEDSEFTAESLLKVPVVMAYYHEKERLHMTSDPTVTILPNELNSQYGTLYKKGAGYRINLATAVSLALEESDNTASLIIADHITQDDFNYIYEGLDIPEKTSGKDPIITIMEYSSILKALYFQSMLNNDDSEKILDMLTKTVYTDMLPSGVPSGIAVAHKIGVVANQLYADCGIVYVPNRPYILCLVSKSDYNTARSRMNLISKTVYDYVSQAQIENVN